MPSPSAWSSLAPPRTRSCSTCHFRTIGLPLPAHCHPERSEGSVLVSGHGSFGCGPRLTLDPLSLDYRSSVLIGQEDLLDREGEEVGDLEGEGEAGVVLAGLQGIDGLA